MATIKVCDRCGGPIRGAVAGGTIRINDEHNEVGGDLCLPCVENVSSWFRNEPPPAAVSDTVSPFVRLRQQLEDA